MTGRNDNKISQSLRYVNSDTSKIPRMVLNEIGKFWFFFYTFYTDIMFKLPRPIVHVKY